MAKILLTAFVDAISGSIRGTTFSRNRSGAYVKGKRITKFKAGSELGDAVNTPQSGSIVQGIRSRFSAIAKSWRTQPDYIRTAWNNAVEDWRKTDALGNSITPSGFNLFVSLNSISQSLANLLAVKTSPDGDVPIRVAFIQAPPAKSFLRTVPTATLDFTTLSKKVTVPSQGGGLSITESLLIEMTRPMSKGISKVGESDFRQILVQNQPAIGNTIDLTAAYQDVFGFSKSTDKVFVRISYVNVETGEKGVPNLFSSGIAPVVAGLALNSSKKAKEVQ